MAEDRTITLPDTLPEALPDTMAGEQESGEQGSGERERYGPAGSAVGWRSVELVGRGTTFACDEPGPSPEAPTVVLLHGWTATGSLNWTRTIAELTEHYRVIALDHRGHGRGIRSDEPFTL
ncbi:MAG TPA: alpha/beta fold hydrolase, partial [Ilumatobacteraceae bacterium]|nr:alpha/beta fold hydrolase [Ilumatobacteraceae bacterium]